MKRIGFLLVLLLGSALVGGAVYGALRSTHATAEQKLDWLAQQLHLTAAQRQKIADLHLQECPQIGKLSDSCTDADPQARQQCHLATARLIQAVSAELTPEQRERYLEIVKPCLRSGMTSSACP